MKFLLSKKTKDERDDVNGFMSGGGSSSNSDNGGYSGYCHDTFVSCGNTFIFY